MSDEEEYGRDAALALVGWMIRMIDLPRAQSGDQVVRFHLECDNRAKVVTIAFNETGWWLLSDELGTLQ